MRIGWQLPPSALGMTSTKASIGIILTHVLDREHRQVSHVERRLEALIDISGRGCVNGASKFVLVSGQNNSQVTVDVSITGAS